MFSVRLSSPQEGKAIVAAAVAAAGQEEEEEQEQHASPLVEKIEQQEQQPQQPGSDPGVGKSTRTEGVIRGGQRCVVLWEVAGPCADSRLNPASAVP